MTFAPLRRLGPPLGAVLAAALFLSVCAPAKEKEASGDWPMFGGTVSRNLVNTVDKGILDSFGVKEGKEKNVKWKAALGTIAHGGPAIAGGRVFVGTNNNTPRDPKITGDKGVVMCFDEKTGDFLWQIVHDKLEDRALDAGFEGVASTPAVDGDRLYYVSNRCELVCADVKGDPANKGKGKILWSLDMMKELKVYPGGYQGGLANCSPLVWDDLVYVVTSNGVEMVEPYKAPFPDSPSFLAVNKTTGKPAWQSNLPGKGILDGQWGSPAAAEVNGKKQVIFPGGDGWLYSFEAKSGELLWKFDCNPKGSSYKKEPPTRNYLITTPVVYEGKAYIGVGREPEEGPGVGHFWCVDITKAPKNKDLSPVNDNFDPKDPVNKDSGLVWHYGGLVTPKPKLGERDYTFGRTLSTAAVHDGLVYVADLNGFLYCFDASSGKEYWEQDLTDGTWASPSYVDGKVYIGNQSGTMFIFPAGKDKKDPIKIEIGAAVSYPVVAAHGVLYINRTDQLFAIGSK